MKQIGTIFAIFILLFVFAKWGPAINFSTTSQMKGEPFSVSGEGKVFVTPDIAKISLGIEANGASLKTVQSSVNAKAKALTDSLKKLGIAEADIKTTSYSVYPEYDYTNPAGRITGFRVSTSYEVTIRDFDKVNDAITADTASGANIVGGVSFELNDKTEKEKLQEARKLAVKDAKDKASGLAGAAGITLGRVINISENRLSPVPLMYADKAVSLGAGSPEQTTPNIQPGTTEINVTITLSYEVRLSSFLEVVKSKLDNIQSLQQPH